MYDSQAIDAVNFYGACIHSRTGRKGLCISIGNPSARVFEFDPGGESPVDFARHFWAFAVAGILTNDSLFADPSAHPSDLDVCATLRSRAQRTRPQLIVDDIRLFLGERRYRGLLVDDVTGGPTMCIPDASWIFHRDMLVVVPSV